MLKITKEDILEWSKKYDSRYRGTNDEITEIKLKQLLEKQRYLNKPEFIELCKWKTPRPRKHYERNDEKLVRENTRDSFSTNDEKKRIKLLDDLKGVSLPIASAILHFAFLNRYPILDFRAIWSLGWGKPKISYRFWQSYCNRISEISRQVNLPIRIIDKALWEYSKQKQPTPCKRL
ncbi:MAG: hypothetical protein Q8M54_08025 [Desulfobaccales bacterium]|nr:hypothetical protein [Desulfobaccales bacterium]